jgi:hypothetical protein
MDNAAYSYTKDGFDAAMEEMKKRSELAWAWMSKIPIETWASGPWTQIAKLIWL